MTKQSKAWAKMDRRRWATVRKRALDRDGWVCRQCGRRGRLEVDHIQLIERGGKRYDLGNLQSLCRGCHIDKTRAENEKRQDLITPVRGKWRVLVDQLLPD